MKTRTAATVVTAIVALGAASTASAKAPGYHANVKQRVSHRTLVKSSKAPARAARKYHFYA